MIKLLTIKIAKTMEKKRRDLTPDEIAAQIRTEAKVQEINHRLANWPFPMFRNVKKNKRAAAKRRNVLRARARQK